ncbi:50S ribosomal protein L4 [Candidatus Micrarchaeota archaeon]|nr:50S ribosomal protein L4 [Candidatus Micrarchaeota archaeon]
MKTPLFSLKGEKIKEIELPEIFDEDIRNELIIRGFLAEQSLTYQPKGVFKLAGFQTSAEYRGRKEAYGSIKNRGISRLPREKLPKGKFGKVRIVPFSVKGRRAHPPQPDKVLVEKINNKEYNKSMRSAIAATAKQDYVKARGHLFSGLALPIVIENKFEEIKKTKDVVNVLNSLGLTNELERGKKTKQRSGTRKRQSDYKEKKSALIVVGEDKGIIRSARNIAGVDAVVANNVKINLLAPGAKPGRLVIFTENAISKLNIWN